MDKVILVYKIPVIFGSSVADSVIADGMLPVIEHDADFRDRVVTSHVLVIRENVLIGRDYVNFASFTSG